MRIQCFGIIKKFATYAASIFFRRKPRGSGVWSCSHYLFWWVYVYKGVINDPWVKKAVTTVS